MSITIDLPLLQQTEPSYASHLTEVLLANNSYATLATVDYGSQLSLTINNPVLSQPIALSSDWSKVTAVVAGNKTFTPTTTPESPQLGEFLYNPYTKTIQVYSGSEVRSLILYGKTEIIGFIPPLLPPPYPQLFTNLPLQGSIQFNRQFEQHPTASFELESTLNKSQLQSVFAPGTELDLYDLPLRINSVSITELPRAIYPHARCKISVSLGSRWQNYIDQPCFLLWGGHGSTSTNSPFQDPECTNQSNLGKTDSNSSTTLQQLLARINIPYSGPNLAPVPIPSNTPNDSTVSPSQLLQERLRVANCFVRWSNVLGVQAVLITGTRVWSYSESDILGEVETSYEAIAKSSKARLISIPNLNPPTPDLVNFKSTPQQPTFPTLHSELPTALSFEYANAELTGKFSESQQTDNHEQTQGNSKPRYVKKPTKQVKRTDGDANANQPLEGVNLIEVMSLCFDLGGQTKTRTFVTEEDGAKVREVNEIWGFAFTALQIYDESTGKYKGNPKQLWQILKQTQTDYTYDKKTGYLLSIKEQGFNTVRYKQESAESPETMGLSSDDPYFSLYNFIQIPVLNRTSYQLKVMPSYNLDGAVDFIKVCNRDGTSSLEPLINPDFAPPYYVEVERNESVAFASHPNPDNDGVVPDQDTKLEPDLIVGEEARFESRVTIIPGEYEQTLKGFDHGYPIYSQGAEITPQKFIKYITKFKAQGPAIATALEEISVEEGTGNPPVAQRRPPLYEKQQQDSAKQASENQNINTQQNRYLIQTQGYSALDPVSGSESFSVATTLQEALTGARCKLAIENWRTGLTERLQIPGNLSIAEGDRFNYFCNGEYRQRVVLTASTTLNILGLVNDQPRITCVTALTLGRWMMPQLTYSVIPLPNKSNSPASPQNNITVDLDPINDNLGQSIDWAIVKSRRNP